MVALPTMDDQRFERSVVLVLSHDDTGTLGVALARPEVVTGPVSGVLSDWLTMSPRPHTVFNGGPVQEDGFICLAEDPSSPSGVSSVDFLATDPIAGRRHRVFRGYAGWSDGQLRGEIDVGVWVTTESTLDDVFTTEPDSLWTSVLRRQEPALARLAHIPARPWLN